MKKILIFLLYFCTVHFWAQENKSVTDDKIYSFQSLQEKPTFIGGAKKLQEILNEEFKKSGITLDKKSKNQIFTIFTIEKDGTLSDISVASKIKLKKEKEIIALFNNLPKWKPGVLHGKFIRVRHSFELTEFLK